jgi:hypothetical protein
MTRPPRRSASTNPPPQVGRFAHPFFSSSPPADRPAVSGRHRMTDWSKSQLGPVSPPRNDGRLALADIIGASGVQEIEGIGELRFHTLGDSGVGHADDAEHVADDMATDYHPDAGGLNPAFLFHLGDVIYGPGKADHYGERFYRPYRHYPGKIIAIPGNHDGEAKSAADEPSLSAFLANFCTEKPVVPTQASGSGIFRETMTLPGPYWMLDGPFARIIGLYSNRLENPGFLEGDGGNDTSQLKWLQDILTAIKRMPEKALIMATHHPPFSSAGHSGSTEMLQSIDEICSKAGLLPDLLLSAHAHNYQFYTRRIGGHQVPFIVAGTGGMPPQTVPPAAGEPFGATKDTTYDSGVGALGYLFVTVSAHQIKTEFWPLQHAQQVAFDTRIVDLKTHTVTRG